MNINFYIMEKEEKEYYRILEEKGIDEANVYAASIGIGECINHMILEELKEKGVI